MRWARTGHRTSSPTRAGSNRRDHSRPRLLPRWTSGRAAHPDRQNEAVTKRLRTVVFDVGGVLIDWDPRHLYSRLIPDPERMEVFLGEVCTPRWHLQHDLGLEFTDTIPPLVRAHPEWEEEIQAWGDRFEEMWGGQIQQSVDLLEALHRRATPLFASTNWGAQNWLLAKRLFPFLEWFNGTLVSGEIGIAKPDPRFYDLLIERFDLEPSSTLYIEDNLHNLEAAATRGFVIHHFSTPQKLAEELCRHGLLGRDETPHRTQE
jgi:2-haloacid dehalogenase